MIIAEYLIVQGGNLSKVLHDSLNGREGQRLHGLCQCPVQGALVIHC